MESFQEMILSSAEEMGIAMTREQAGLFERYHALLIRENGKFNLTRVPDNLRDAIDRNYLDSIAPLIRPLPDGVGRIADVGAGAGFPGIPLAIMLPGCRFSLMDASGKRSGFLETAIRELHLNGESFHLRAEDAARQDVHREGYDLTVARAVAPMNLLAEYLLPLTRPGGWMLAMKGPGAQDELTQAQRAIDILGGRIDRVEQVRIPGRDWSHSLVWIQKSAPTPQKYPRRAGVPEKRPLI